MKRRNADCGKIRRPIKRNKIAEQFGSNTLLYIKFLLLWAFVITADFLLEFRFEFLWPFWLLLRSVYDSFKYKGLAFSVLFVCIAITSDLVCLFFIPVQWLFFAASTYVWVQYVWHTDKGICLPTIILWILFVYLEAAIRWKDSRNIPHLDLCRPFAAHCIGYPVVTLGFGFKSYVGYRIRQRKQREVAKDNDFYMQLLQEALPKDETVSNGTTAGGDVSSDPLQQSVDHQLSPVSQPKELAVTAIVHNSNNNINNNNSNGSSSGGHNNHHHHHSSKNAQSHTKSQSSAISTSQVNGHAGTGSNLTTSTGSGGSSGGNTSTMNGGVNHSKQHLQRKSLDKESSGPLNGKTNSYSYHHQQQQNNVSNSAKESSRSPDSPQTNGTAMSPKEKKDCDSLSSGQKSQIDNLPSTASQTSNGNSSSKSTQVGECTNNHDSVSNRSKHQQNGHVVNYEPDVQQPQPQQQQQQSPQPNHIDNDPPAEPKSNRSGRKNRVKQKENANHQLAAVRLAATLALASSITTLTTTAAASTTATASTTSTSTTATMTSKDNHLQHHEQQTAASTSTVSNNTHNGTTGNAAAGSTPAASSSTQATAPASPPAAPSTPPVIKVCDTCSRLEADVKKLRSEIGNLKQNENEIRQKYDSSTSNLKSCLQVKQKDYDELQNKFQDLTVQRQQERQNLQTVERRLCDERRHRQSLESQLQNERKHRKQAEEKAARAECGEPCKLKRQQLEMETQKLRRELISSEDAKLNAEKQNRSFEQEMRKFEVQLRNRESQQSAEVLMSALAAMQDKNATLEKNLSAETRVKLDLFSALGDTRRQLEIATCSLRTKDKEILDLKAKIVQLLAVMPSIPNDGLCLSGHGPSPSGGGGGSHMRLSDAPQLLSQSALNGLTGQPSPMSHMVMNNPPLISQLGSLGVLTSTITTASAPMSVGCAPANVMAGGGGMVPPSVQQHQQQQQQQQQQQHQQQQHQSMGPSGVVTVTTSNGQIVQMQNSNNCPSSLDPNASVYTPKNNPCSASSMVGGAEA